MPKAISLNYQYDIRQLRWNVNLCNICTQPLNSNFSNFTSQILEQSVSDVVVMMFAK